MRWETSWVTNERIRLKSSDIGTHYWRRQADGRWVKEGGELLVKTAFAGAEGCTR